jgi:multisubunit Na+/H+ antiporter MnhC subunit
MKKIIIITALVLTSAVTAFSLTASNTNKAADTKLQQDAITTSVKNTAAPKSDIATAD